MAAIQKYISYQEYMLLSACILYFVCTRVPSEVRAMLLEKSDVDFEMK